MKKISNKGFSLIELIIVIALLAILMLVLVPNIITLINKNDVKSCHNLEDSIIKATKEYVVNNKYKLNFNCVTEKEISLSTLIDSGDLKLSNDKLINPITETEISLDTKVKITYNCTTKEFSYNFSLNCE